MSAVPRTSDSPAAAREALSLWTAPTGPGPAAGVEALLFEYSSRGDRVPARLLLPAEAHEPAPLILLQHGAGGAKNAAYLEAAAIPWVRRGAAVASIDFPLHGQRHSDKLSEWMFESLAASTPATAGPWADLWHEFAVQSVADLQRALDALAQLPQVDTGRCVYAAFSLGAMLGASFCAADPRPRAAALALGGGGFGPEALDPARRIGAFAPRPLLFVNATRDERVPRSAAEALHAGAGQPKRVEWFESGHTDLPGRALKTMWLFLAEHLEID